MAEWNLSYEDMETLRPRLIPRIKQAIVKYLLYVQGTLTADNQKAWVTSNLSFIDQLAQQISPYMMSEPTFVQGGTSISDADIQSRVEYVINTYFMPAVA